MDNYETYYKKLMGMKKADIIREGANLGYLGKLPKYC